LVVELELLERFDLYIGKFEFSLRDTDSECMAVWNILRTRFLPEVERIGMKWVGEKGKAWDGFVMKSKAGWLAGRSTRAFRITYEKSEK
jgi:hypothetical protein